MENAKYLPVRLNDKQILLIIIQTVIELVKDQFAGKLLYWLEELTEENKKVRQLT